MTTLYKWDGTPVPIGSSVDVVPLNATENRTYTAPTGKAYSPVTVSVAGGGQQDGLSPSPAVTSWLAWSDEIKFGGRADMGRLIGAGNTLLIVPRDRFENKALNRALFGRGTDRYGLRIGVKVTSGHPTVTVNRAEYQKYGTYRSISAGSATFSSAAWRSMAVEYGTGSVSVRIFTEGGNVETQTISLAGIGTTYDIRTFTQTIGRCAVLLYGRKLTDAEVETLTRQYEPTRSTYTPADFSGSRWCIFTVDDIESGFVAYFRDHLLTRGIYPTLGARLDFLGQYVSIDDLLDLQSMGCEIAYHGLAHDSTEYVGGYDLSATAGDGRAYDVSRALDVFSEAGIKINGFIGPNTIASQSDFQNRFLWFRDSAGIGDKWSLFDGSNLRRVNHYKQHDFSADVNSEEISSAKDMSAWLSTHKADLAAVQPGEIKSVLCHSFNFARVGAAYDSVRAAWEELLDYMIDDLGYRFITPTDYYRAVCNDYGDTAANTSLSGIGAVPGAR